MTLSRTFGSINQLTVPKSATALFNNLGIYRFCLAVIVIDFLDLLDELDYNSSNAILKYAYAGTIIAFMVVYFLRWKKIEARISPIIFLMFFIATGLVFTINFFVYDYRESYISAFIAPLVFALAIFIPANTVVVDSSKIVRDLTFLLSVASVFYLVEAIIKPLDIVASLTPLHEVQVHKSIVCVLALSLCILTRRNALAAFVAAVTILALALRPLSTLVLALTCCLPLAIALRPRVLAPRPFAVLLGRALAMATLLVVVSVPLLLYFYFDDISSIIKSWEIYLKYDLIGGQSNMAFRLAILKYAFTQFDATSFWYGSGLAGSHTVHLAQLPGWSWWSGATGGEDATIHSDFVVVLVLTGILGYSVFSLAFYLALRNRFRQLDRPDLRGNAVVLQSISIIGLVALLIYCSDQPWLSYYDHANVVWMLLLISEVARKSKIIDNPTRSRRVPEFTLSAKKHPASRDFVSSTSGGNCIDVKNYGERPDRVALSK